MAQPFPSTLSPLLMLWGVCAGLAGCNSGADDRGEELAAASSTTSGANLPAPLVPAAEAGEKGARNVLLSFARALENKQFDTAWALLGPAARAGRTQAQFAADWADLTNISVAILDGEVEGAAGSVYYTAPATITAADPEGRPLRYEGPIVLRRVNDVPGASAAQLRWHIASFELTQSH